MSQGVIAIPMWIPQIGYAAGLVILLIAFVDEFIHVVRGNLPRYEKPKPRPPKRWSSAPCRAGCTVCGGVDARIGRDLASLETLTCAVRCLLLLLLLTVLLAGGVWIAIALMACGFAGMMFVGGAVPPGAVLATTVWGNSASWTLAALPLFIWMGEILFRTGCRRKCSAGWRPGSTAFPAG